MEINIEIPEKLGPIFEPKRYKVMHGGRGGGKSVTVAKALLIMGLQRKMRILCTREIQKSLADSVIKLLGDLIEEMGLTGFYEVQKNTILGCNGTEFLFAGLQAHTVDSLRSYVNIDIAWVEEAHAVSSKSWNVLIPTIRKEGSEIWATLNPDQESDYVYERFIKGEDPQAWVCQIGWQDNKWFPMVLHQERLALKRLNDDLYQHVWEGKCRSTAGLLFKRVWFHFYDVAPVNLNRYISSDYAGGVDPDNPDSDPDDTCHGVWGVTKDGDLYLLDGYADQEDTAETVGKWLELVGKYKPLRAFDEKGPILRAIDPFIRRAMRAKHTFVARESLASAGSKADRALGFAALASAGCVYLPNTPFGQKVLNQLCAFNGQDGRPDDCVDMCSLMARGLDFMAAAGQTPVQGKKPDDDYELADDDEVDNWKTA